jgi:flagellar protein FliO/FliZ
MPGGLWLEFIRAALLFGVVLFLAWITTRFIGQRMSTTSSGKALRVVDQVVVGRDRSLLLVEVGGRCYLLGATLHQFNLIDAIDDPEVLQSIAKAGLEREKVLDNFPPNFANLLSKVRARILPPATGSATRSDETELIRQQIERLRRLQNKE